jgi:hypothetical protein
MTDAAMVLVTLAIVAFGALVWLEEARGSARPAPRQPPPGSFQQGTLQVISAYTCEKNCTKDLRASGGTQGECSDASGAFPLLDPSSASFANATMGSPGMTQGPASDVACQLQRGLCFLMRNTGNTVVRLSDLGAAQVVYELPSTPQMGERALTGDEIGAVFVDPNGLETCCRFSDMAATGACATTRSIASRETFVVAFYGTFVDAGGSDRRTTYKDARDQRLIVSMNLPSGFKVAHQVV